MSWLFSQALVEEYLGENFLDGEQSAPLNGKPTQQAYCAPGKMTAFSRLSRFGMMFKPLTENLGEELLTLFREDFHAKTSAPQEKAQELMESEAECGEKWHASFVKYDHDLCLCKTHQCSLLGDLDEFLETWPRWGLMQNGECWERQTLEQTIKGTGFGFSPNGVDTFHTPNTTGLDGGSNSRKALKKKMEKWPTPTVMDSITRNKQSWEKAQFRPKQGKNLIKLGDIQYWPTPTSHNAKETNAPSERNRNTPTLAAQAGGTLNPTWVEWLMGWPLGWTDLKRLETDKFHCVQQQPGES